MQKGLLWASGSSIGKRESRRDSKLPPCIVGHFVGGTNMTSYRRDCSGICGSQPLGIWLGWRRGRSCNNQHTDLGKPSSYLQCPSVNPYQQFCSSVEPRRGLILTRELSGVQICLILWALEPVCPCPSKELNHSPTHLLRVSSGPHRTRRAMENSLKQCGPVALEPRGGQTEMITTIVFQDFFSFSACSSWSHSFKQWSDRPHEERWAAKQSLLNDSTKLP